MADPMRAHRGRQGKSAGTLARSYPTIPGEVVSKGYRRERRIHSMVAFIGSFPSFKITGAPGVDFVSRCVHVCTRL